MHTRRDFIRQSSLAGFALAVPASWFQAGNDSFVYTSPFLKLELAASSPRLLYFSTDSLGQGQLNNNPVMKQPATNGIVYKSKIKRSSIGYFTGQHAHPDWEIVCDKKSFVIRTNWQEGAAVAPFELSFSQRLNHCTLLGCMQDQQQVKFPSVLHFPGMGSFRVHCDQPDQTLHYDAYRFHGPGEKGEPYVKCSLPGANALQPQISYHFESVTIYPDLPVIRNDKRFDGFRRNFINIFQLNPRIRTLANNSASDACAFTMFIYAELARKTPALTTQLTAMDMVRNSLDQYLGGMKAYGQVGYRGAYGWQSEFDSGDSAPSLIMSACYYILDTKDHEWARLHYESIRIWAMTMIATDRNNDGLIEYGYSGDTGSWTGDFKRPSNWWDTIGFGHDDAYSNILAYRAVTLLANVAEALNKKSDQEFFNSFAAKLKEAFYPAFFNPATGVLGGWRSKDGKLHDYYFLFVNSMAVTYDLVDTATGIRLMNALLQKMKEVGYDRFDFGLPGNLLPIAAEDYTHHDPRWGYQQFQVYENGGATGCYAYFTIHALFKLGMRREAEAILFPMLDSYTNNGFQGQCEGTEMTRDWRTWTGECWGYEGFLVDNYLPFLAVFDLETAKQKI
ncbi:hypothetical protein [Pseudoflavitalea rhizosphaerae]|uniref:alpha-L-rhamnosidase-related protein n=1 Tax=Pseudoflavitalea rhizosphaerae TaxID=1884793 RepID=UPI000F8E8433|nr:hypothetical protein [Pseudoflavitalea rhizosphaerae]